MLLVPHDNKEFSAFVERILTEPYDDASKLVFADWLCDRDDPRGPLLRVVNNVRQAAGPYKPLEGPPRAKVRDSKDPLKIRTGPVPVGWKWPYPENERIPDITRPKLESVRGAHGSGRLLSIAMTLDLLETFDIYKPLPVVRSCMAAVELSACRLITKRHRDYVFDVSSVVVGGYKKRPYVTPTTMTEERVYFSDPYRHLYNVIRSLSAAAINSIGYCTYGRFGSFVNTAHSVEHYLNRRALRVTRGTDATARQLQWHLRTRMIRMTDAWKAMMPWEDGKRVWDAEEELKQNSPPKSDQHKKYQIACGKLKCDHTRINGKTAYLTKTVVEPPHDLRLVRNTLLCDFCNHERSKARRP